MQQVATRPWTTTGVALVGASMIAAAPGVAPPPLHEVAVPDVQLSSLIGDTAGNITNLVDYFAGAQPADFNIPRVDVGAPFPILQQLATNQINYLGEVLHDPSSIGAVLQDMFGNLGSGLAAPFGMFSDVLATGGPLEVTGLPTVAGFDLNTFVEGLIQTVLGVPDLSRLSLFNGIQGLPDLAGLLGLDPSLEGLIKGLLNFTASPVSGVLLGAVGPVLGPLIALSNGLGEVSGGDPGALLGIPGNMLNAFLNGGESLDLLPLLERLGIDPTINVILETGICPGRLCIPLGTITGGLDKTAIELGGLLSGPGSIFNALTVQAGLDYTFPTGGSLGGFGTMLGDGAGPLGSLIAADNSIAHAIDNGSLVYGGLLSTIAGGLGLSSVVTGLADIQSFLIGNLLDPVTGFLTTNITDPLALGITDLLGSDLGVAALSNMVFDIPALLLTLAL